VVYQWRRSPIGAFQIKRFPDALINISRTQNATRENHIRQFFGVFRFVHDETSNPPYAV
jgi:hypothetical protein